MDDGTQLHVFGVGDIPVPYLSFLLTLLTQRREHRDRRSAKNVYNSVASTSAGKVNQLQHLSFSYLQDVCGVHTLRAQNTT
jgi:hypothetical protein